MKLYYLACLPIILYLFPICQGRYCLREYQLSGVISDSTYSPSVYTQCWYIDVPQDFYVRLIITQMSLSSTYSCAVTYVEITFTEKNETYKYCSSDRKNCLEKPITALSNVSIELSHLENSETMIPSSFELKYHIEHWICAEKDHFRCSNHTCIHQYKVCDGVRDCENGMDESECEKGILAVKGINSLRDSTLTWLKNQRSSAGWGKNTHRAITALYLAKTSPFRGQNLEEDLVAKELELQASVALLRNSTSSLTVSELSMFVNALTVTCHNVRRFYGYDLVQILAERMANPESSSPGAYLTLCNSNWTLTESDTRRLLKLLEKHSKYPFHLDVQAMTVMALTCAKNQTKEFTNIVWASKAYNEAIEKFVAGQLSDGSFGNVYTTALVTQALIGSGQENNEQWNVTSTVQYLMKQLNSSSVDFLSAYLALPIFSGKSLMDIKSVNCGNSTRKQDKDNEISEVTDKLGGKTLIQYSLYVGDQKDIIHTIFLRMPENSSAYNVMRVAQVADPKYKFLHTDVSGHMYVYGIAGITNDPEAGKFWLIYTGDSYFNGTVKHHTESPDKFILEDEAHLIMWYKTAKI